MGLRSTYRPALGPLRFNTGREGLTSIALALGPITLRLWSSDNAEPGVSSVDLPGPISVRPRRRTRERPPFSLDPDHVPTSGRRRTRR